MSKKMIKHVLVLSLIAGFVVLALGSESTPDYSSSGSSYSSSTSNPFAGTSWIARGPGGTAYLSFSGNTCRVQGLGVDQTAIYTNFGNAATIFDSTGEVGMATILGNTITFLLPSGDTVTFTRN